MEKEKYIIDGGPICERPDNVPIKKYYYGDLTLEWNNLDVSDLINSTEDILCIPDRCIPVGSKLWLTLKPGYPPLYLLLKIRHLRFPNTEYGEPYWTAIAFETGNGFGLYDNLFEKYETKFPSALNIDDYIDHMEVRNVWLDGKQMFSTYSKIVELLIDKHERLNPRIETVLMPPHRSKEPQEIMLEALNEQLNKQ